MRDKPKMDFEGESNKVSISLACAECYGTKQCDDCYEMSKREVASALRKAYKAALLEASGMAKAYDYEEVSECGCSKDIAMFIKAEAEKIEDGRGENE